MGSQSFCSLSPIDSTSGGGDVVRPARHSSNRLGSKRILFPSTHAQWLDATEETTKTSTQLCSSSYRRSGTCVIFALVPSHHAGKVRTLACTIAQARGKIATTAPKSNITILGGSGNWTGQIKTLTIELILKYNTFIYISYFIGIMHNSRIVSSENT